MRISAFPEVQFDPFPVDSTPMKRTTAERVFSALSLVVLYVFPLLVLAVLGGLIWATFHTSNGFVLFVSRILVASGLAAFGWAVIETVRYRPEPEDGVALSRDDHPALWEQVDEVAAAVGVPSPDRVLLDLDANAGIRQVAGRNGISSELVLGLPFLAADTVAELRATLGHEFGHVVGGDTAQSARIGRALNFLDAMHTRSNLFTRWYFTAYRFGFHLLFAAGSRAAEERADRAALSVASVDAAISSLKSELLAAGTWVRYYPEAMVKMDLAQRRAPLLAGLAEASEILRDDVCEWAVEASTDGSIFDTHPKVADRIAAYERLRSSATAIGPDDTRPAIGLLDAEWLARHESALHGLDLPSADWPETSERAAGVALDDQTLALLEGMANHEVIEKPTYAAFFDFAVAVRSQDLVDLLGSDEDEPPAEATRSMLGIVVASGLARAGAVRPTWGWTGEPTVVWPDDRPVDIADLADRMLAGPTGVATVREQLAAAGLDLDSVPGDGQAVPRLLGIVTDMIGNWSGVRDCLLWSTGIAFVPAKRFRPAGGDERKVDRLADLPLGELIADPAVNWIPRESIAAAAIVGRLRTAFDLRLDDGTLISARESDSSIDTDPEGYALAEALRGKLRRSDWEQAAALTNAAPRGAGYVARWLIRDGFVRTGIALSVLGVVFGLFAALEYDTYRMLHDTDQLVRTEAVVASPPDEDGWLVVTPADSHLPTEIEMYEEDFTESTSLRRGDRVTLLVHPDDPENYVVQEGTPVTAQWSIILAGVAAAMLVVALVAAVLATRRYRTTHGVSRRPTRSREVGNV